MKIIDKIFKGKKDNNTVDRNKGKDFSDVTIPTISVPKEEPVVEQRSDFQRGVGQVVVEQDIKMNLSDVPVEVGDNKDYLLTQRYVVVMQIKTNNRNLLEEMKEILSAIQNNYGFEEVNDFSLKPEHEMR